jgi:hypothetical protein
VFLTPLYSFSNQCVTTADAVSVGPVAEDAAILPAVLPFVFSGDRDGGIVSVLQVRIHGIIMRDVAF